MGAAPAAIPTPATPAPSADAAAPSPTAAPSDPPRAAGRGDRARARTAIGGPIAAALRWERPIAALAGLLVAFGFLHPAVAAGGVLLVLVLSAVVAYRAGAQRRHRPPRIIGSGLSARTPAHWDALLRHRPIRAALAVRFIPGEHALAFTAAGVLGRTPPAFLIASAAAWALWVGFSLALTAGAATLIALPAAERFGTMGLIAGALFAAWLPAPLALALTRDGRRRLRLTLARAAQREYWPTTVQYALLAPLFVRLALRHGPTTFTCCNPGIAGGGGMVGESKKAILDAFNGAPQILPAALIPPGPDPAARARAALDTLASRPDLGGFPVILKPDEGQRGFSVRLARTPADVESYFLDVRSAVILQRYHPGPHECGLLWVRDGSANGAGPAGRIFSITRKSFPVITGDGRRTLEDLIHDHPRYRRQAAVFLERFAEQRTRILAEGETLRLAQSGNHCQGTLFTDGADLITPDLERAIDALCRGFAGGLDIGRFDIRYESDEALRRGEGFAVVELNGTAGESTNIYDPTRSIFWAYAVLARQWRLLYELGAERRRNGARPLSLRELWRESRRHFRERTGSPLAD